MREISEYMLYLTCASILSSSYDCAKVLVDTKCLELMKAIEETIKGESAQ